MITEFKSKRGTRSKKAATALSASTTALLKYGSGCLFLFKSHTTGVLPCYTERNINIQHPNANITVMAGMLFFFFLRSLTLVKICQVPVMLLLSLFVFILGCLNRLLIIFLAL